MMMPSPSRWAPNDTLPARRLLRRLAATSNKKDQSPRSTARCASGLDYNLSGKAEARSSAATYRSVKGVVSNREPLWLFNAERGVRRLETRRGTQCLTAPRTDGETLETWDLSLLRNAAHGRSYRGRGDLSRSGSRANQDERGTQR